MRSPSSPDRHVPDWLPCSEETLEDVRTRMYAIQENEVIQLRELTNFLDLEISFVHSYLDELQKVKSGWVDEYVFASPLPGHLAEYMIAEIL